MTQEKGFLKVFPPPHVIMIAMLLHCLMMCAIAPIKHHIIIPLAPSWGLHVWFGTYIFRSWSSFMYVLLNSVYLVTSTLGMWYYKKLRSAKSNSMEQSLLKSSLSWPTDPRILYTMTPHCCVRKITATRLCSEPQNGSPYPENFCFHIHFNILSAFHQDPTSSLVLSG
jgi:hypothetical protein